MKINSLFLMICFLLPQFLSAQTELEVHSEIDWFNGTFQLDITSPIEEESNQPTGRFKTEQYIIRQTPVITGGVLQDLRVDSTHTIADMITEDPVLLRELENLSQKMKKVFTTATGDRKFLTVRYILPIFPDLAELVITHSKPHPSPVSPIYTANEDFTGIIIYAAEALPYQGNSEQDVLLNPCLFPRLYDSSMNLIHSAKMTEPEALQKWGNAGYTYSHDLGSLSKRIGVYPLRTMARKVYGKNKTDLILPDETVKMLISSEHNREMLRQGRVIIMLPQEP
ncbi:MULTISPECIES: hypothetical protein [unclassified Oceanispirochaeta]|uniref:hypothetical protein n=1 Tax=unclassified Oceanispirochaeta TaxID=2635722 RepID=UPI000E0906FD|nr:MULTISPECIES: hypothetical protein [unclassified Oceanispirochaeta]MBF9014443.1 hypothetical protein [Oceanispirochaeta sp. M2]NPD74997.1 hypothetical protein [Oceanispirochaeta sp. M1]RDG29173.1 hypothetical protein DV872_23145 [Oceanispirochaeta sp. M1]